jgi:hypothetical protein
MSDEKAWNEDRTLKCRSRIISHDLKKFRKTFPYVRPIRRQEIGYSARVAFCNLEFLRVFNNKALIPISLRISLKID